MHMKQNEEETAMDNRSRILPRHVLLGFRSYVKKKNFQYMYFIYHFLIYRVVKVFI